ncbi:Maf family protein [Pseudocolwellia sp. HL-MZ19]|uniref:Maf family protein n=1 Tax=unclassified Pseudocolwellia TaxID=2848178 RepID=UPI003CF43CDE
MTLSLVLASQSPRRQELLTQIGYTFTCKPANINEDIKGNETPFDYVNRLAIEKAQASYQNIEESHQDSAVVLGSDTSVVYNDCILGKPADLDECIAQLQMLSGNTHQVLTSIAVISKDKVLSEAITTDVTFKVLSLDEITCYWETGEPQDKAGSYGIQGIAAQFVINISGSYSAVVGLPLYETAQLLSKFGVHTPIQCRSEDKI